MHFVYPSIHTVTRIDVTKRVQINFHEVRCTYAYVNRGCPFFETLNRTSQSGGGGVELLIRIQEIPGSNFVPGPAILTAVYLGFLQSLQANASLLLPDLCHFIFINHVVMIRIRKVLNSDFVPGPAILSGLSRFSLVSAGKR